MTVDALGFVAGALQRLPVDPARATPEDLQVLAAIARGAGAHIDDLAGRLREISRQFQVLRAQEADLLAQRARYDEAVRRLSRYIEAVPRPPQPVPPTTPLEAIER
jgi:hypothetical protein